MHVDALSSQSQGRHETASIGHPAAGHERDLQFISRARQENEVGDIVLARAAATFEAIDADGVAPNGLRLDRVTYAGASVDHLHARLVKHRRPLLGVVTGRLPRLDTAVDDGPDVARIVRGADRRHC